MLYHPRYALQGVSQDWHPEQLSQGLVCRYRSVSSGWAYVNLFGSACCKSGVGTNTERKCFHHHRNQVRHLLHFLYLKPLEQSFPHFRHGLGYLINIIHTLNCNEQLVSVVQSTALPVLSSAFINPPPASAPSTSGLRPSQLSPSLLRLLLELAVYLVRVGTPSGVS